MEWMLLPLKRYADFSGRSRRKEYWMFALLNVLVILAGILIGLLLSGGSADYASMSGGWMIAAALLGIWFLAIFIPSLAVTVRRLHDRDLSGWWYLGMVVASAIPFVGFIASIAFIVVTLLPGTDGPNRFGPDPKNPAQADVFA
ncbi:DUF805 domain-containing protein [Altericroceibacterium endophyticum]|nr:DUF805 domain-containing protein [Altericroceibacterium endophyticum]